MQIKSTEYREAFLADNPTELHVSRGVRLLEHPKFGDESPVYALVKGQLINTFHYDADDETVYAVLEFIS
jgi:hypothetical protein